MRAAISIRFNARWKKNSAEMKHARLDLARDADLLPQFSGTIGVFGQIEIDRLKGMSDLELACESPSFVSSAHLKAQNFNVAPEQAGPFAHAIVFLPRAKAEAQHLIAKAVSLAPNGWIIVDGQKTDGIESIAKQIGRIVPNLASYSKGHGKTIWYRAEDAKELEKWRCKPRQIANGFQTAPGVFSADGVDPASAMLMEHLPHELKGEAVDLGAGWGFLSEGLLARAPAISQLHLIEDNAVALDCARSNISDPRAQFHWADALNWHPNDLVQTVIMNPPFHTSRSAEPGLGREFIKAAARMLKPTGKLFMVANAHLPYEPTLEEAFAKVETLEKTSKFKVFYAERGRAKV